MHAVSNSAIYAGLNALIILVLAGICVLRRRSTRTGTGDGGHTILTKAIRAHGNNVEYVPTALILIVILELMGGSSGLVHGLGILLTVSRISHAYGILSHLGTSPGRFLGTTGTWLVYVVGAISCIYLGITAIT